MAIQLSIGKLILVTMLCVGVVACSEQEPISSINDFTEIAGKKWDLTKYKNSADYVTEAEAEAAFFYTSSDGYVINDALRKGKASIIKKHAAVIKDLASLINKSRNKKCKFYRFIHAHPKLLDQMKTRGQIYVERGFFSATLERYPDDEGQFSNREIIIIGTSPRCADISPYSRYESESEILFPPGTEFVVTKNMSGQYIYLKEKVD